MILYLQNDEYHYELENITRMFYWRVEVAKELPAQWPEEFSCAWHSPEDGILRAAVKEEGKDPVSRETKTEKTEKKEIEHELSVLLFECLSEVTGKRPPFGIMTGVRPAKYTANLISSGMSPEEAERYLQEHALVSEKKARLVRMTAQAGMKLGEKVRDRGYSLYVSIPFCPSRCSYCSFVSKSTEKERKLITPYLDALCREMEFTSELVHSLDLKLQTVYIGGGTPTVLNAEELKRVTDAIRDNFEWPLDNEYSVEAGRPDTITMEKFHVLKDAGVTRISINPQTGNDDVLRRVGRRHTAADIEACYRMAREAGFDNINADFIAGLPGDDLESFKRSMTWALEVLKPENITVHALTLKRASRLREGQDEIFSPDASAMVDHAEEVLTEADYRPYYCYRQKGTVDSLENTGYAKPGTECLYNLFIMDEVQSIIACGAGAVTKVLDPKKNLIERVFDLKYPQEYLDRFDEMLERKGMIKEFYIKNGI
ncbi:MAG: coproporphyrinogen dehydrogenase HemZ [Oscillospiraceae bacterium]|nr:coproporphyrinogen dehydrogenase HemZ [Oscillospiraceae bacterium]